jgi:DNA-binding PadR family transcriptional regulator
MISRVPATVLGEFEQLVLFALLRLGPDAYGATIRREIEARTTRSLSISAVYTTLERLEQKGLVRSRIGEPTAERGGRRRKHFDLLPLGARALKTAYEAFSSMTDGLEQRLKAMR